MNDIEVNTVITKDKIERAKQVLVDNGIEADEAEIVLQSLCYVLIDTEIYEN